MVVRSTIGDEEVLSNINNIKAIYKEKAAAIFPNLKEKP